MDKLNYEEIGRRVREARWALHLTQETAAEKCDITSSYYGNLERGDKKMSIETLAKLSKGLNVSTDYLLFGGTSEEREVLNEIVADIQRNADEKQFEKYLAIIKAVSTIIDKL